MKNKSKIFLQGCRQNNLKNFSLSIPKYAITVITGVSGSGKSSLAFDTLFVEGQRRYLAHLSAETRALIKELPKPDVDFVEGLAPTLALNQGRRGLYARGTVATYTDVYDFLSLLYSNIGEQHSPATGKQLIRYSRQEITEALICELPLGTKFQLLAPIKLQRETVQQAITRLEESGFIRFKLQGIDWTSGDPLPSFNEQDELDVVVDRLELKEDIRERLANSIETVLDLSHGVLKIQEGRSGTIRYFTEIYVCPETGLSFAPLQVRDFNFNSMQGACPLCRGSGGYEKAISERLPWSKNTPLKKQIRLIFDHLPKKTRLLYSSLLESFWKNLNLSSDCAIDDLPKNVYDQILQGAHQNIRLSSLIGKEIRHTQFQWKGVIPLLDQALNEKKTRGSLANLPFIDRQICSACQGARLKPEALACLIEGEGIHQICGLTVSQLIQRINQWNFQGKSAQIANQIIPLLSKRLGFLEQVGLGYLELNRQGNTLSDGEAQRVQLASQIGAKLSGIIYILDEPSLGLHRQDIKNLHHVIQELKSLDNTIVLVEHERSLIALADHIIELGPGAGQHGGHLIFEGSYANLLTTEGSPTGQWLSGRIPIPNQPKRKIDSNRLIVDNVDLHNLKNFSVRIPLKCFVGFCGVSGSGKSTLVIDIIAEKIKKVLAECQPILGLENQATIRRVVISRKQIDRFSERSIPATYVGIMTSLRQLFAETRLAKARGYTAARFSLNKRGGRCETCEGLGQIKVNMQLMADLHLPCEVCQGLRYNHETLQITWNNLNFGQILELCVEEAAEHFKTIPSIFSKLELLRDLGLDYLTLGQPFTTLSTGEIQRLRLVADLADPSLLPTLYILDEPSAGLHFQDIRKLLTILHRLVDKGHTIFVIEHHLDILLQADWLIELGPGAGPDGGKLIYEGTIPKFLKEETATSIVCRLERKLIME